MIISDTKKFIFIHIPKTGGMSIRDKMEPHATVNVWKGRAIPGVPAQTNKGMSKHAKARVVKANTNWGAYFTFAFVRNPWSWLVSGYHYAKKDKRDWRYKEANRMPFNDYLRWTLESPDRRHTTLRLGQFDFLAENGKIIVDYVGKLETITKNFSHVCKKIGVQAKLNHLNRTAHKDYRKYYDTDTRKLVTVHFRRDIQKFGYAF